MEKQKGDLFIKVSIDNIHNGFVAKIGLRQFAVLTVISSFADKDGECFPSIETIAELCGISKRQVMRLIDDLCEVRINGKPVLIRETKRKNVEKARNEYKVLQAAGMVFGSRKVVTNLSPSIKAENEHCEVLSEGSDKSVIEVVTNLSKDSDKNVTLTITNNNNHLTKTNIEQDNSPIVEDNKDSLIVNDNNSNYSIVDKGDSNSIVAKDTKDLAIDTKKSKGNHSTLSDTEIIRNLKERNREAAKGQRAAAGRVDGGQDSEGLSDKVNVQDVQSQKDDFASFYHEIMNS